MNNISLLLIFLLCSCTSVVALKTGKGYHRSTRPGEVDILVLKPHQKFKELGVISARGFLPNEIGKMHNALREKASIIGANAVVITQQELYWAGFFSGYRIWVEAAAIKLADKQSKP